MGRYRSDRAERCDTRRGCGKNNFAICVIYLAICAIYWGDERDMQSSLRSLAASPWRLSASALNSSNINDEDLEKLLQFLSEVNDVLFKAFHPLKLCLQRIVDVPLDQKLICDVVDELIEIQKREFYHIRLVCNRLHGLRDHAHKHIEKIVANLPNAGEWWSLFTRLNEREGYIEYAVREETEGLVDDLKMANNKSRLLKAQNKATSILSAVSSAIRDMECYHALLYSETDRVGFLALTDLSKTSLRQQITQHLHVEEMTIVGDVFQGITNSTIISRSKVEGAFNRLQHSGQTESVKLLVEIGTRISNTNNAAAGAVYSQLADEISKSTHDKSVIKSCWNGLVAILPSLANLSAAVIKAFAI